MFLDSPSSHWSGSAGAVYPVLERLERRGLVAAAHAPNGKRDAWTYTITPAGRGQFRAWLEPPFAPDVVSLPPDPLRTRLSFLSVLPAARRARFVARAVAALRTELELLSARDELDLDERSSQAAGILAQRARLEWCKALGRRGRR